MPSTEDMVARTRMEDIDEEERCDELGILT